MTFVFARQQLRHMPRDDRGLGTQDLLIPSRDRFLFLREFDGGAIAAHTVRSSSAFLFAEIGSVC